MSRRGSFAGISNGGKAGGPKVIGTTRYGRSEGDLSCGSSGSTPMNWSYRDTCSERISMAELYATSSATIPSHLRFKVK